jgi:hypothetical protein
MKDLAVCSSAFRKSSYSVTNECVEVGSRSPRHVAVRDSKNVDGDWLFVSSTDWQEFLGQIKADRLQLG